MNDTVRPPRDGSEEPPDEVAHLVEAADQPVRGHVLVRGFVLGAVVTVAMAMFVVQNTATIEFDWLWFDFEARLWLMLLVAFVAGLIVGPLLIAGWRRAAREQTRRRRLLARFKKSGGAESKAPSAPQA